MSSLKHIATVFAAGTIPVHKYKSQLTGLTVVIGEVEGPLVNGYFTLATEAHDDDGLPHTLEHLIFLGSELYPYKGVLDLLANRCLASGTNAWTDTDHTCYTIKTVGKDGFFEMMPIYLDHILYPTLSDAGFITEVHHIAADGKDGGVVYCEMQGRENSAESRACLALLREIYPNCGYSAETGGIMHNLRTSTTNEKVRNYHSAFYRPENLTLIITGPVSIEDVAKALEPFEKRILSKPKKPEFVKPWRTPVAPLTKSVNRKIAYPSDCEDCGLVHLGWRGPNCINDIIGLTACSMLLRYLSETSVSPLQRELVEISDPYASHVSFNLIENSESIIYFSFDNVPLEKVDLVYDKAKSVLEKISNGEEKIDMNRMQNILERCVLEYYSSLESNPHESVTYTVIADVLYGETNEDFETRLNITKQIKSLMTKDESFWIDLLKKYMINSHYVVIRAVPSSEEQKRMSKEEESRIEEQCKALKPEGLAKKGEELSNAMATNEIPPPSNMLTQLPIPDVKNIKSLPSTILERGSVVRGDKGKFDALDLDQFPVHVTVCDVKTTFCYLIVSFNTNNLPPELRPYLLLYLELLCESPIRRENGELVPYEEVVTALESDTVAANTSLGLESPKQFSCGSYSNTAVLMIKVDSRKYIRGIQWVVDLLNNTEFTVDRIRVCGAKIANAVAQAKRNGNSVTHDLLKAMYYNPATNVRKCSMIQQYRFLNSMLEKLDDAEKAANVINDLNRIRHEIITPARMSLYIAADWKKVLDSISSDEHYACWRKICKSTESYDVAKYEKPEIDYKLHKEVISTSQALGLGCVEGAFLCHAIPCPIDINHEAYVPLMLFMQYLTQAEGPFWRQIRGQGLAYGYHMHIKLYEQLLYFSLYRASNVILAFKQFKKITEAQLSADTVWEPELLETAKSSLIFEYMEREKSIDDVVLHNFSSNCFHRTDRISDINRVLIHKINQVTESDMKSVGERYVKQIFSSAARTAVVCHPDNASEISKEFKKLGFDLTVTTNIENSLLGQTNE